MKGAEAVLYTCICCFSRISVPPKIFMIAPPNLDTWGEKAFKSWNGETGITHKLSGQFVFDRIKAKPILFIMQTDPLNHFNRLLLIEGTGIILHYNFILVHFYKRRG